MHKPRLKRLTSALAEQAKFLTHHQKHIYPTATERIAMIRSIQPSELIANLWIASELSTDIEHVLDYLPAVDQT